MILKGVLLLLVLSTSCGCVYRRCDYIVREIEPCGFDLHRKQVKVRGVFTRKDRSFIFDETKPCSTGELFEQFVIRMPVYLMTLPLQVVICEFKENVPMEGVVDLGPGSWENVRMYKLDCQWYWNSRNGDCKKICDLKIDGKDATLQRRNSLEGDLVLCVGGEDEVIYQKALLTDPINHAGWLVVDDSGVVAYISQGGSMRCCTFEKQARVTSPVVAYKLMWQNYEFKPIVELAYGELVLCKED